MEPATETFASPHRGTGWAGLVTMAALLAFTFSDGAGPTHLAVASGALLLGAVSAVLFLRPEVAVHENFLLVRNSLRDVTIPWRAIQSITVRYAMEVDVGEQVVRADAFGRSPRQLRTIPAEGAEPDYTEIVVTRLRETAVARGGMRPGAADSAGTATEWRWLDVGVLVVLTVLTVVLILLAS